MSDLRLSVNSNTNIINNSIEMAPQIDATEKKNDLLLDNKIQESENKINKVKEKSDLYKEYQRARRDYTEFAVAKKNVEIIIDRDHDGVHDFMEIDEHEHDR